MQKVLDNATPSHHESRGGPAPVVLVDRAHRRAGRPAVRPPLRKPAKERSAEEWSAERRVALVGRIERAPDALKRLGGR
ncbi:hypothetical protein [Streptomyces sp. NPDC057052]|uniref:hypothetical protein n=1 Tax=Streptomyces sp. NPDC057052 TaxID=3346010 RepID=UPI00362D5D7C